VASAFSGFLMLTGAKTVFYNCQQVDNLPPSKFNLTASSGQCFKKSRSSPDVFKAVPPERILRKGVSGVCHLYNAKPFGHDCFRQWRQEHAERG
jgi:hypothetical protein